jgi:hypothetical protein
MDPDIVTADYKNDPPFAIGDRVTLWRLEELNPDHVYEIGKIVGMRFDSSVGVEGQGNFPKWTFEVAIYITEGSGLRKLRTMHMVKEGLRLHQEPDPKYTPEEIIAKFVKVSQ